MPRSQNRIFFILLIWYTVNNNKKNKIKKCHSESKKIKKKKSHKFSAQFGEKLLALSSFVKRLAEKFQTHNDDIIKTNFSLLVSKIFQNSMPPIHIVCKKFYKQQIDGQRLIISSFKQFL